MATARMFTEKQCGRVLTSLFAPELADFADYQLQLTVIYTDGKDASWSEFPEAAEANGITTGAFLYPSAGLAAGSALIDLRACAAGASSSRTVSITVPCGHPDLEPTG